MLAKINWDLIQNESTRISRPDTVNYAIAGNVEQNVIIITPVDPDSY